jgi:hypothetical protein
MPHPTTFHNVPNTETNVLFEKFETLQTNTSETNHNNLFTCAAVLPTIGAIDRH